MNLREHVILLHGLWMRGLTLLLLRRRLRAAGFRVQLFDYASLLAVPKINCARLVHRMLQSEATRVHLVGHSLGGVIALQATRGRTDLPFGHIVCLGSPLVGSAAARGLARWRPGRAALGRSNELLCDGIAAWDGSRPVGVIAGRRPLGMGRVFSPIAGLNDGTVGVSETQLPGISDHCVIDQTHTGLPFSREAANATIAFLKNASFG